MTGDPSIAVPVPSGTATVNLNHPHCTGNPVGSHALPDWISCPVGGGKPVLTEAQVEALNPSFLWFKVLTSDKVPLGGAAVTVGSMLYGLSSPGGGKFWVGDRKLEKMSGRTRKHLIKGIEELAAAGFLVAERVEKTRSRYQLTLPTDPPSGVKTTPRRTAGVKTTPRRTETPDAPSGVENTPGWSQNNTSTGVKTTPRRPLERSKNNPPPTDDDLVLFEYGNRSDAIPHDDRMEMARAAVETERDAVIRRYQRQGTAPADLFLLYVREGMSPDLAASFDKAKHGAVVKAFHDSGLDPSTAARIVLAARLATATDLSAFMVGVLRNNGRRSAA